MPSLAGILKPINRLEAFRVGQVAAGGGKPLFPYIQLYDCKTTTTFSVGTAPGTVTGGSWAYELGQYNVPLLFKTAAGILVSGAPMLNRHPTGHAEAIALGYQDALIVKSAYRFVVTHTSANDADETFIIAWKFSASNVISELTAGLATSDLSIEMENDLFMTRGWTWQRFSATHAGGSVFPATGVIKIDVDHVPHLSMLLHQADANNDNDWTQFKTVINDTANGPTLTGNLLMTCFHANGTPMPLGTVTIQASINQKVVVYRSISTAETIDEGTDVS